MEWLRRTTQTVNRPGQARHELAVAQFSCCPSNSHCEGGWLSEYFSRVGRTRSVTEKESDCSAVCVATPRQLGVLTRLLVGWPRNWVSILDRGQKCFSFSQRFCSPPAPYPVCTGASSSGIKLQGHETDIHLVSRLGINETITPLPHTSWVRNFTLSSVAYMSMMHTVIT